MAIGDIPGDLAYSLGQGLTPEQRAARQAALAGTQSSLATSPISPPPTGPIGRAQQQLPNGGLYSANLGVSGQDDPKQTSFDISNTPAKYLSPGIQPGAASQSASSQQQPLSSLSHASLGLPGQGDARQTSFDITNTPPKYLPPIIQRSQETQPPAAGNLGGPTSLGQINLTPFDPVSVAQQPSSLTDAFKTAPAAQSAVSPPSVIAPLAPPTPGRLSTELPSDGTERSVSSGTVVRNDPQAPPPAPSGSLGQVNMTPFDPVAAAQQPTSLTAALLRYPVTQPQSDAHGAPPPGGDSAQANPSAIAKPPATVDVSPPTGPLSSDQYRPTGASTDEKGTARQGGQIVAKVGPNGEASFSNIPSDQQAATGLGQISVKPAQGTGTPQPNASLASLGSAGNLGDGIGTFSQARPGDAALSADRFARANELRQGYANQDRLSQALGAQFTADHTNVVHDSSKPLTAGQKASDLGLQQTRTAADDRVSLFQALLGSSLQNRSGELALKQATSLNDLQLRATAPDATDADHENYLRAKDPAGLLRLQQAASQKAADLAKTNAQTESLKAATEKNARSIKALPTPLQKLEDDDLESIGSTGGINAQLQHFTDQINSGKLKLSPTANLDSVVNHATGGTDENSRNYAAFKAGLVKLTNDSLRLNKGTQTEGDAQRASDEILNNLKDPKFVLQRLGEIQGLNTKAAGIRAGILNARRNSQGVAPLDINTVLGISAPAQQKQTTQPQAAAAASSAQTAGPRPGQIEDGHVFLGGNPANPSSWRAQ